MQVADAVARVCADEPDMRARLERAGDTSPLDRVIAAVRDDGEVSGLLDALHAALQRGGTHSGYTDPPGVVRAIAERATTSGWVIRVRSRWCSCAPAILAHADGGPTRRSTVDATDLLAPRWRIAVLEAAVSQARAGTKWING